jgi:hypothetical protein
MSNATAAVRRMTLVIIIITIIILTALLGPVVLGITCRSVTGCQRE